MNRPKIGCQHRCKTLVIMGIRNLSEFCGKRHLSIPARKRAISFFLSGIKNETRIMKEYGLSRKLIWKNRLWYWKYFQEPHMRYKNGMLMGNDNKSLKRRIRELEKANRELEKKLKWEETKSLVYKKLIEIAEEDLATDISKKDGAGRSRK